MRGNRNLQKVQISAGFGFSGWLKATPVAVSNGDGLGKISDGLAPGLLTRTRILSQGLNFVAGAAFWQGRVQISWWVYHFRKVKCRFRDRHGIYFWHGCIANPIGMDAQGGAYRFRGRGSIFARSGIDFMAGASFSQGQVQNSWQM